MNTQAGATWLRLLPLEMGELSEKDFIEPIDELEPDMRLPDGSEIHEAGDMTEDEKRLYTLWKQIEKSVYQRAIDAKFRRPTDDDNAKITELTSKADCLQDIFWVTLRDNHHAWQPCSVGVRRGYKVVWYQPKDNGPRIIGFGFGNPFGPPRM